MLKPILTDFAETLSIAIERQTMQRVRKVLDTARSGRLKVTSLRAQRGRILCYYPGCKNLAAPRFGMFCAALHKTLPVADKKKHRAQVLAKKQ